MYRNCRALVYNAIATAIMIRTHTHTHLCTHTDIMQPGRVAGRKLSNNPEEKLALGGAALAHCMRNSHDTAGSMRASISLPDILRSCYGWRCR